MSDEIASPSNREVSAFAVFLFLFTDWSFSDKRYLNVNLVNFSEIVAMVWLENLDAECLLNIYVGMGLIGDFGYLFLRHFLRHLSDAIIY